MNYGKTNPLGIDFEIQRFQNALYAYLQSEWGLTDANYDQYGRCYRTSDGKGQYYPQAFKEQQQYFLLSVNDNVVLQSFFDVHETVKVVNNTWNAARVDLHMLFNIAALETLITGLPPVGRYDEEARIKVQYFIENNGFSFHLKEIQIGAKKAWSEFSGNYKTNTVIRDIQPFAIMRFDLDLPNYNYSNSTFKNN
jgi:hypothetical protein